jgi:hypothetical protein
MTPEHTQYRFEPTGEVRAPNEGEYIPDSHAQFEFDRLRAAVNKEV